MDGQLADHLAAQNAHDNLGEFAKELGVFEDTETQARLARDRDNEVAMADGWQALDLIGRHLLGSALGTRWADPCLAAKRNGELSVAGAAGEASDTQIWVTTQEEAPEGLLGIRLQRPVCVDEPAVVGRDKRLQVVYENSPEGARERIALTILTPASRWERGGKSKGHQTSGISREWSRSPAGSFRARITSRCHSRKAADRGLQNRRSRSHFTFSLYRNSDTRLLLQLPHLPAGHQESTKVELPQVLRPG